jgi:dipeptidyl aminopeptidase/acylaminoacyl peptidase
VRRWTIPAVELLEWTDALGNPGYGYLYKPIGYQDGLRYPTIVLPFYGAPYSFDSSSVVANEYPTYVFASRGIAVLRPDVLLYSRKIHGGDQSLAAVRAVYAGNLAIVEAAVAASVKRGVSDGTRVGIAGLSYGSRITSYAITHSKIFHAAALTFVAPSAEDALPYYSMSQSVQDVYRRSDVAGSLEVVGAREASVTEWADRVQSPVLIDASDAEMAASVEAAVGLRERKKPVEFIVFPDALHYKKWPRQLRRVWQLNVDWFDFWLRDFREPDPQRADQFRRWDKLRADWKR